jgi:hypothetical protein
MPKTTRKYEMSLEQQVQRIRDAWFTQADRPNFTEPGWPIHVFEDRLIVEREDGLFSIPYTLGDDDVINFGEPVKVMQEFIPARSPLATENP